ncbi:MAG: hypothetical protein NZ896_01820 [Nitrososphaerales archaeon]|nr:hypothetical protein [Nitrososphaerales archaeon]MCX8191748.1 hypothetical protein [Nitrososphaerales archaeon]
MKDGERDWREKVTENLDYYIDTDEGRKEFSEMSRKERELLEEYIRKSRRRIKDIVWLSRFCLLCVQFVKRGDGYTRCAKLNARIVKPFYGKPVWGTSVTSSGEKELFIVGFDWKVKSIDVPESLVEVAISTINNGYPYACFEPRLIKGSIE